MSRTWLIEEQPTAGQGEGTQVGDSNRSNPVTCDFVGIGGDGRRRDVAAGDTAADPAGILLIGAIEGIRAFEADQRIADVAPSTNPPAAFEGLWTTLLPVVVPLKAP